MLSIRSVLSSWISVLGHDTHHSHQMIEQVSSAGNKASVGEVFASMESLRYLSLFCRVPDDFLQQNEPQCIASRQHKFLSLESRLVNNKHIATQENHESPIPIYESIRKHCRNLHRSALERLQLQMALYVHPVVRGDELAISNGATSMPSLQTPRRRLLADAEVRSVFTMFVKLMISPGETTIVGDEGFLKQLGRVMHITSRELDRYSGQLRQFIMDDKGMFLLSVSSIYISHT